MSVARPIYKKVALMLTRRVRGRTFLLRPCEATNQIVGYVVAVMAKKWNVTVHAIEVMSNHWHVVMTDNDGTVVEFSRDSHQFITKGLNAHFGESESIWASSQQTSHVALPDGVTIIKEIAYAMANPVEAGLVRYGDEWPGIRCAWPHEPLVFKRPPKFFRGKEKGGNWPDEAVLELGRPPGYDELSDEQLATAIDDAIYEREEMFRTKYDAEGREFLGREAVLAQSRHATPTTPAPLFGISPTVATGDKWRRIERLNQNKAWRVAYYEVLPRWLAGDRDVVFPHGTYKMRVVHGARCADPPT